MGQLKRSFVLIAVVLTLLFIIAGGALSAQTDGVSYLRFVHGIPDAPAIDVYTDGQLTAANLQYATATTYAQVSSGTRQLVVTTTGSTEPLWQQTIEAGQDLSYTLVAAASDSNLFNFAAYEEDRNSTQLGSARFTAVHAIAAADALDVVLVDGRAVIPNIAFGQPTSSIDLPVSFIYDILLVPSGGAPDAAVVTPDALALTTNTSYMLVVLGSADEPEALLLEAPVFADSASGFVRLAHGVAGAPAVQIAVDGTVIVRELAYGEATQHIPVATGDYSVQITTAEGGDAILEGELAVEGGRAYTGVAVASGDTLELAVFSDDLTSLSADEALISVINTLPDGQFASLSLEDGTVLSESLGFAQISEAVAITPAELAGTLNLDLETEALVTDIPAQAFYGGVYYNVFVINNNGQPDVIYAATSLLQNAASAPGGAERTLVLEAPTEAETSSEVVQAPTQTPAEIVQVATVAPPTLAPTAAPTQPAGPTARVVLDPGANLQMRQYPSTTAFSLGLAPSGSTLIVNGRAGAPVEGIPSVTPTDYVDPVSLLTADQDLNPAETWLNVTYLPPSGGELTAWVNAQFLDVRDDRGRRQRLADLPTVPANLAGEAIGTQITSPTTQENVVTATVFNLAPGVNLHIRRTPDPAAESLVLIPNGTALQLVGVNPDRAWAFVIFTSAQGGTVTGWATTEFLSFSLNGQAVTLADLETRNLLIEVQATRRGEVSGSVSSVASAGGDPLRDAYIAQVNVNPGANLHLRREPNAGSESLGLIPANTRLVVSARDGTGQWVQTEFEGREGWVNTQYLVFTFNGRPAELADIPVAEGQTNTLPEATSEATPIGGIVDVTVLAVIEINVDAAPLTGEPGGSSAGLPVLPRGTRAYLIAVSGPDNNYSYIQVVDTGLRGWIVNGSYAVISTPTAP